VILLGSFDSSVTPADRDAYLRQANAISGGRADQAADGSDKLSFAPYAPEPGQPMTVVAMQQALKAISIGLDVWSLNELVDEEFQLVRKLPAVEVFEAAHTSHADAGCTKHSVQQTRANRTNCRNGWQISRYSNQTMPAGTAHPRTSHRRSNLRTGRSDLRTGPSHRRPVAPSHRKDHSSLTPALTRRWRSSE